MRTHSTRPIVAILAFIVAGCGSPREANESSFAADPTTGRASAPGVTPASAPRSSRYSYQSFGQMGGGGMGGELASLKSPAPEVTRVEVAGGGDEGPKVDPTPRKIVYTADVDLVVEDFTKLETAILKLVKESEGYLADTDISGSKGSNRTARWKIRVPIEKFDTFLESAATLGELTRRQIHSQDVTEEFYDLEARIKNKKVEEARLLKHLEDSTGKLDEILAAERELSRVREEVERQEGRLRLLANLSSLTTVTITAVERTDYVPPTDPGFATRASRQFTDSTKSLVEFVEVLTLWGIGIVPWLPVYLVLGIVILIIYRMIRRRVVAHFNRPRPAAT